MVFALVGATIGATVAMREPIRLPAETAQPRPKGYWFESSRGSRTSPVACIAGGGASSWVGYGVLENGLSERALPASLSAKYREPVACSMSLRKFRVLDGSGNRGAAEG